MFRNKVSLARTSFVFSDALEEIVSTTPTLVVFQLVDVLAEAKEGGAVVTKLRPGTLVTLMQSENGWVLITKDGQEIGYLATSSMAPIQ
nr:SH3 domain-containing protein [uncultured Roseibium sp.]